LTYPQPREAPEALSQQTRAERTEPAWEKCAVRVSSVTSRCSSLMTGEAERR
jgi:hypothetical protein